MVTWQTFFVFGYVSGIVCLHLTFKRHEADDKIYVCKIIKKTLSRMIHIESS